MKKFRFLVVSLLMLVFAFVMVGCGSSNDGAEETVHADTTATLVNMINEFATNDVVSFNASIDVEAEIDMDGMEDLLESMKLPSSMGGGTTLVFDPTLTINASIDFTDMDNSYLYFAMELNTNKVLVSTLMAMESDDLTDVSSGDATIDKFEMFFLNTGAYVTFNLSNGESVVDGDYVTDYFGDSYDSNPIGDMISELLEGADLTVDNIDTLAEKLGYSDDLVDSYTDTYLDSATLSGGLGISTDLADIMVDVVNSLMETEIVSTSQTGNNYKVELQYSALKAIFDSIEYSDLEEATMIEMVLGYLPNDLTLVAEADFTDEMLSGLSFDFAIDSNEMTIPDDDYPTTIPAIVASLSFDMEFSYNKVGVTISDALQDFINEQTTKYNAYNGTYKTADEDYILIIDGTKCYISGEITFGSEDYVYSADKFTCDYSFYSDGTLYQVWIEFYLVEGFSTEYLGTINFYYEDGGTFTATIGSISYPYDNSYTFTKA